VSVTGPGTVRCCLGASCNPCTTSYPAGTTITLVARPLPGAFNAPTNRFAGWTAGPCASPLPDTRCTLTLNSATSVTAAFGAREGNLVFVSSAVFPATLGSATAYDVECGRLASAAGLAAPDAGVFVAWTSDLTTNAISRLGTARGFVRMDGLGFADRVSDVAAGSILNAVVFDELGASVPEIDPRNNSRMVVMTGTDETGQSTDDFNCLDFTDSSAPFSYANGGHVYGGPRSWTRGALGACNFTHRIYCFEKDKNQPLVVPATSGRRIYLAPFEVIADGGVGSADLACMRARPAGVTLARAIIAATNQRPSSILSSDAGQLYIRPDGQIVGSVAELRLGILRSGVWQFGDGGYPQYENEVFVGTNFFLNTSPAFQNCNNWTDPTALNPIIGLSNATNTFFGFSRFDCSNFRPSSVYCAEQ
jgi:hypothetical protein